MKLKSIILLSIILLNGTSLIFSSTTKRYAAPKNDKKSNKVPNRGAIVAQKSSLQDALFPRFIAGNSQWRDLWTTIILPYVGLETSSPTLWATTLHEDKTKGELYQSAPVVPLSITIDNINHLVRVNNRNIRLVNHLRAIRNVIFNHDQSRFVAIGHYGGVFVFDAQTGKRLHELIGHTNSILFVTFNRDGSRIITTSRDCTAKIWNTNNGSLLKTLCCNSIPITAAQLSVNNSTVLTTADDNARLWNYRTGKPIRQLPHDNSKTAAEFGQAGRVLTRKKDGKITVWKSSHNAMQLSPDQIAFLYMLETPRRLKGLTSLFSIAKAHNQKLADMQRVLQSFDTTAIPAETIRELYRINPPLGKDAVKVDKATVKKKV